LVEIAKEFDLYTKITGGQRIDMFGARLDQLPVIWEPPDCRRDGIRAGLWEVTAHREKLRG
jgi:NAD(P)H-nitrite reductase large subunit